MHHFSSFCSFSLRRHDLLSYLLLTEAADLFRVEWVVEMVVVGEFMGLFELLFMVMVGVW